MERARVFLEMGLQLFPRLDELALRGWEAVDEVLQETKWVGPTLSKMFLVSTHLCLPRLKLLERGIEVGIGAQESYKILFPGIQAPKDFSMLPDRREILLSLLASLDDRRVDALDARLRPMIAWCAERAKARFPTVPAESFSDRLDILSFQVALCEWRKFRNNVDKKAEARRGMAGQGCLEISNAGKLTTKAKRRG
jgi:hypothetical protein